VGPHLDGIQLPKTDNPETLVKADHYLTFLERTRRLEPGRLKLIPLIESTEAVARVEAICRASTRLIGVSLGGEDYATSLGVVRTREGAEIEYARARTANAARAAGLVPIDCPEPDFRDMENFERDLRHSRSLGYRGKYCIHPAQVDAANRAFSPPADQIEWAERVVAAYREGERQGLGAISLDGQMIDRPAYLRALELFEWQRAIEARAGQAR
jgi:citrate lyase subunit beta/citryl-CoA lyase